MQGKGRKPDQRLLRRCATRRCAPGHHLWTVPETICLPPTQAAARAEKFNNSAAGKAAAAQAKAQAKQDYGRCVSHPSARSVRFCSTSRAEAFLPLRSTAQARKDEQVVSDWRS